MPSEPYGRNEVGMPAHLMGGHLMGAPNMYQPGDDVAFQDDPPDKWRRWMLGFPVTNIAASGTGTPTSRPQTPYWAKRLIVTSIVSAFFRITSIDIGQRNQLTASNPVPAQAFAETAVDAYVSFDTASTSQDVAVGVTNLDTVNAHDFDALFLGVAAKE